MPLQRSTARANNSKDGATVRYATPRFDELPTEPLPLDPAAPVLAPKPPKRRAKTRREKWLLSSGFQKLDPNGPFYPFWRYQEDFAEREIGLSAAFAGGLMGPATQKLIGNSSFQFAMASYFAELAMKAANEGDPSLAEKYAMTASKLNDYARTNIATAKETAYRDGKAFASIRAQNPHAGILEIANESPGKALPPGTHSTVPIEPNAAFEAQMRTFPRIDVRPPPLIANSE